jgi:uncharacterized membrane protein YjfL (UPF0719 family)
MTKFSLARVSTSAVVLAASATAFAQAGTTPAPAPSTNVIGLVVGLILAVVALFVSLALAMKAVTLAFGMFDKLTKGVDELAEIKRGNVAVGLLLSAVIFAIGNVISSGVTALTTSLMNPSLSLAYVLSIIVGVVILVIALWVGTYVIGLALRILDTMAKNIEVLKEVASGNVAISIMVTGVPARPVNHRRPGRARHLEDRQRADCGGGLRLAHLSRRPTDSDWTRVRVRGARRRGLPRASESRLPPSGLGSGACRPARHDAQRGGSGTTEGAHTGRACSLSEVSPRAVRLISVPSRPRRPPATAPAGSAPAGSLAGAATSRTGPPPGSALAPPAPEGFPEP